MGTCSNRWNSIGGVTKLLTFIANIFRKEIDIYVNASLVRDLTATEIGTTGVSFGLIGSNGQFYGGSGGYFDIYDYELLNIK